jgi:hypothetical protein
MPNYRSPIDEIEFFRILQHVMERCPDRQMVEALHRAAMRSPGLKTAYHEGAWKAFGEMNRRGPRE